ncbi:uncharacterized protein PHACADRAFT_102478 [Phanerochaete carnosa HHB-10118-sp]|uniref:Uncharacterized protein n=1 Tax=Phanerochaete carnosa (strain HHB-10118-sp) TaxID=650164 RepID=K5UP53_PHACS|nr:uncharacterized protein PHACADRAFT_102478 [Phanerochaete carnosa HHB-10118-sp]EKM51546.1 hypothetical protein PHACADRAFT_102478 [Phanerochaete carnosa HHB-10118-sp]
MCLDGNSAELSVHYVNSQLQAFWENAAKCAAHTVKLDFKSSAYEKSRRTRALREYHYLTRKSKPGLLEQDLFFSAKFGRPELKFICNHSVFLCLMIESGHLNLDIKDAVKPGNKARPDCNRDIESLELVFHVPIIRTSIRGQDSRIGNESAEHLVQMQILKLEEAKLIVLNPDSSLGPEVKDALKFYMDQYLNFLKMSGSHILFDLSDFDSDLDRSKSNYSLIRTREVDVLLHNIYEDLRLLNKFGCDVLAQFYKAQWMAASALRNAANWGNLKMCLGTICSDWIVGSEVESHFFINFDTPTVQVLCPHEVILKFHLRDLAFFKHAHIDAKQVHSCDLELHDWTIAFIVNVFENDSGMIQLDFETARFSRNDSFFGVDVDTVVEEYIQLMINFFTIDYLDILVSHSFHLCLGASGGLEAKEHRNVDWTSASEGESEEFYRQRGQAMLWMERIQRLDMQSGFDEVIVLSETTINRVLESRLKVISCFRGKDDLFRLDILGLKVRLLSNGKAVLYVQTEGHITVKKKAAQRKFWIPYVWEPVSGADDCRECAFETLTLAYEVDLQLVEQESLKVDKSVVEYLEKTGPRTTYAKATTEITSSHSRLKHLILDFANARYIEKLSDVEGLECDENFVDSLKTVRTYILKYFESLVSYGHSILHTVMMATSRSPGDAENLFAFTDVDFKVLTKRRVALSTSLRGRETVEAPIVMIYGMCTGNPMPALGDTWALGWLPVGKRSVGTLVLSKRVFFERCILHHLQAINARTTLVPQTVDVIDGQWHISLTTWEKREERLRLSRGCQWTPVASKEPNCLTYEWHDRDEWKRKHEGDALDKANGEYALECSTRNIVRLPTAYNSSGMVIKIEGSSSIRVNGKNGGQSWKNKTVYSWSATVALDTSSGALQVRFSHEQPVLSHDRKECSGHCPFDIAELHKESFSLDIEAFKTFMPALRQALEQSWDYCTMGIQQVTLRDPVFTRKCDFVCELGLYAGKCHVIADENLIDVMLPADPSPPVMLNSDAWKKHTEIVCGYKCTCYIRLLFTVYSQVCLSRALQFCPERQISQPEHH